jgi:hypothetical protein
METSAGSSPLSGLNISLREIFRVAMSSARSSGWLHLTRHTHSVPQAKIPFPPQKFVRAMSLSAPIKNQYIALGMASKGIMPTSYFIKKKSVKRLEISDFGDTNDTQTEWSRYVF